MEQLERAQAQHRQANLAALAAIGPRRKRPLEVTVCVCVCVCVCELKCLGPPQEKQVKGSVCGALQRAHMHLESGSAPLLSAQPQPTGRQEKAVCVCVC